jgi:mono/diheme cytochrome c family protein
VRLRGLAGACVALIAVFAATGCGTVGTGEGGAAARGKPLFVEGCGQCHVLADAGTQGTIGPNLDDGFATARRDGLGEETIRSVVRGQIAYPVEEPVSGQPGMPANIFEGEDADAVAAYVAEVAGLPVVGGGATTGEDGGGATTGEDGGGEGESESEGEAVFASNGCGSCHVLEAAGSSGSIGPNLDETKPSHDLVVDRVTNGSGAMPSFADSLTEAQIAAVADYVVASTSG